PTSGGLVFTAGSAATTVRVPDPAELGQVSWAPALAGVALALIVHLVKALARPALNAATLGLAAPVLSAGEDAGSVGLSLLAVVAPLLAAVTIVVLAAAAVRTWRRRRRRRVSQVTGPPPPPGPAMA
ncbi:MAG: DUF4126 domain-containing protein, partial [Cellulomonadaceae bacterium]